MAESEGTLLQVVFKQETPGVFTSQALSFRMDLQPTSGSLSQVVLSSGYLLCGPGDDLRFPFKGVKSLTTTGVFPARPHGTLHPLTPSLTERHTSCLAAPVSTVD